MLHTQFTDSGRGRSSRSGLLFVMVLSWLLVACASLPESVERIPSQARVTEQSPFLTAIEEELAQHPGQSGFRLLGDGLDAFAARMFLAEIATDTLDVQYYLFHGDDSGRALTRQLLRAADRGVRVRLLVDDMATAGRDAGIVAVDSHPNVEVRLFNPFANRTSRVLEMGVRFGRVTRRMHNKSFTADGIVTIVGGRNVGNEYFSADPDIEFGDLDVMGIGPISAEVSAEFDLYWNSELAYPASSLTRHRYSEDDLTALRAELDAEVDAYKASPYGQRVRESTLATELLEHRLVFHWGQALVLSDLPEKLQTPPSDTSTHMTGDLMRLFNSTQSELIIISPYFVPGWEGVAYLTGLVDQGIRVRILTNSLASNDVWVVHSGYAKYRLPLLRGGVELYETKAAPREQQDSDDNAGFGGSSGRASLHAKTFVLDRDRMFIGSLNLDPRSWSLNTEMGIVLENETLATGTIEWFDSAVDRTAYRLELVPACSYRADCWGDEQRLRWRDQTEEGVRYWDHEPNSSEWTRTLADFVAMFPIEGQL